MDPIIGLDEKMDRLKEELEEQGYSVVTLNNENIGEVDAIVTSGMDSNLMLREDIQTEAPVINASGKTAEEILQDIENSLPQF